MANLLVFLNIMGVVSVALCHWLNLMNHIAQSLSWAMERPAGLDMSTY